MKAVGIINALLTNRVSIETCGYLRLDEGESFSDFLHVCYEGGDDKPGEYFYVYANDSEFEDVKAVFDSYDDNDAPDYELPDEDGCYAVYRIGD